MKGNMFLGYAAGSVGDVTFSRSKGQQVARARNRKPNNPKTRRQMTQRSLFISAVKFYTRGIQNLFRFAFEDKRATESDYNAFMRVNAKNGVMLRKADFQNSAYPAIGKWVLSQGALTPCGVGSQNVSGGSTFNWYPVIVDSQTSANTATIGHISQLLIATGNFAQGDILTFVLIQTDAAKASSLTNPVTPGDGVFWTIEQIIVDVADTRKWNDTLNIFKVSKASAAAEYEFKTDVVAETEISASCIIHSRETDGGVKVSTERLANSPAALDVYDAMQYSEYKDAVLADWNATEEAVLQGIIAYRGRR